MKSLNTLIILFSLLNLFACARYTVVGHDEKFKPNHHHDFSDVNVWVKRFENESRAHWQKPDFVIEKLQLKKTDIVADIGSATGYFPVRLARAVPEGRVWGVDIEPNFINYLNYRAHKEKIPNLISILGTEKDPLLPETVDLILSVNTYHHIAQRVSYFANLRKKLDRDGEVVIVDFKMGDFPVGPKDSKKLSENVVITEMDRAGFRLIEDIEGLPYQYFLVFELVK